MYVFIVGHGVLIEKHLFWQGDLALAGELEDDV